ncbi:hypothetical protein [uncultured Desulfobacter sp.]|uniref:hypothetical protein n=1 Tax=uncultured Desulfobacter sp. TaxID=240139 RepID=UPI00374801A4
MKHAWLMVKDLERNLNVNVFESLTALEQQNRFYIATIIQESQFWLVNDQTMNKEKKMIRKNFIAAVSLSIFILAAGVIHAGHIT